MSATDSSYTSTSSQETPNLVKVEEEQRRKQIEQNQGLIRLLRSWRDEGDAQRQKEAWEFIRRALDEDRLSDRKLFPCDE